jgi:hypothetical protein
VAAAWGARALWAWAPGAAALAPPSAAGAAAYGGRHAAAHRGHLAAIARLAGDRAALEHGRHDAVTLAAVAADEPTLDALLEQAGVR